MLTYIARRIVYVIPILLSVALIQTSLGPEAWAQLVPRVGVNRTSFDLL